jgi:hypothetical protein
MFRRLATWMLLVPLSLNGLWMLCENAPQNQERAAAAVAAPSAATGQIADCKTLCPTVKPVETGSICLVGSNGDGRSIAVYAFALTMPSVVVSFLHAALDNEFPSAAASIYSNPVLDELTPPPKV